MTETTVYTGGVSYSPAGNAVEVQALLLSGAVKPGMFLHVPMNSMLDLALRIRDVIALEEGELKLLLECEDAEEASLIMAFNFSDETLRVTDDEHLYALDVQG